MPNHIAALRALAFKIDARQTLLSTADAHFIREIAAGLEKAQAEPTRYIWVSGGKEFILDAMDFAHLSEHQPTEAKKCYPLFAAQPPAIPISPPQEWVDFLLDDSSDNGNCSLAEFRAFANRAWEKMRSVLAATEPKAVVVSQSKDAEDAQVLDWLLRHPLAHLVDPIGREAFCNTIRAAIAAEGKANG